MTNQKSISTLRAGDHNLQHLGCPLRVTGRSRVGPRELRRPLRQRATKVRLPKPRNLSTGGSGDAGLYTQAQSRLAHRLTRFLPRWTYLAVMARRTYLACRLQPVALRRRTSLFEPNEDLCEHGFAEVLITCARVPTYRDYRRFQKASQCHCAGLMVARSMAQWLSAGTVP